MQRITASGHQETVFNNGTCNSNVFNGTEGVITTPGYPSDLGFNNSCFCKIDVGGGKIEVTIETVSLPDGSRLGIHGIVFTVGVQFLKTKVVYVPSDKTSVFVFVGSNTNQADAYGGVKLLYRRISDDTCKADYTAHYSVNTITSLGFPQSLKVDSTCVYSIHAFNKHNVVHIGFEDFSFGPNDMFTIYDYANDSIIYGPLTGHQDSILTKPAKSASVKIVIVTNVTSSVEQSYVISFKEVPKDTCLKEYYESSGLERSVSSAVKSCSYIIRPERHLSRVVVRFESLTISENNFVTVNLMSFSDRLITHYNLSSNSSGRSKSFDGLHRGNWFEIRQSADVTFDLKFKTYTLDKCPFYLIADRVERKISSPGFPDPFPNNSSCEYYIRSRDRSSVIYIRFTEELLSPGDKITVYDTTGGIIARYNGTLNEELSVTTKRASVRVVFTFGKTKPGQRFWFYHKMSPSDSCVVDYKSTIGQFPSFNRSCEYNIYLANNLQIEMKFDNLLIPANRFIKLVQKRESDRSLANLNSKDSGKTKYFRSRDLYNVITISADANAVFHVSFQPFIKDRTIYLYASNGTLLSPNYPNSYLFAEFEFFTLTFHVKIPYGHVLLNFTEVMLSASAHFGDYMYIYDGNTTSAEHLGKIEAGKTEKLPAVFLASSNYITVKFGSYSSYNPEKLYRFKAVYTTLINVSFCKPIQWPHSHAERNLTLPGRKTKFLCDEGYAKKRKNFRDVMTTRTCGFDGDWEDGDSLVCLKICPRLDNKLKENSSLRWIYFPPYSKITEGGYVRFFCNYKEELVGPEHIRCTSYGNYSSIPPVCKKIPERGSDDHSSSNAWKYGVGFGGAAFIIGIVLAVLRVCFGCFTCCAENSSVNSIPMSEVKYSSP